MIKYEGSRYTFSRTQRLLNRFLVQKFQNGSPIKFVTSGYIKIKHKENNI